MDLQSTEALESSQAYLKWTSKFELQNQIQNARVTRMHCMCEAFVHLILCSDICPFLFSAIQYICVCKPFVTAKLKQMFHGSYHYRLQSGMEIYLGSQQTVPCMKTASNTLPAIRRCVYRAPHIANQVVVSINWSGDWTLQLQSGRSTKARLDNHPA